MLKHEFVNTKIKSLFVTILIMVSLPFSHQVRAPAHMSQYEENIYRPYEPRASLTVKKWYSPSGSFLQIDPIRGTNLCGPTMSVNVTYTTEANTNFLFYYKVRLTSSFSTIKEVVYIPPVVASCR